MSWHAILSHVQLSHLKYISDLNHLAGTQRRLQHMYQTVRHHQAISSALPPTVPSCDDDMASHTRTPLPLLTSHTLTTHPHCISTDQRLSPSPSPSSHHSITHTPSPSPLPPLGRPHHIPSPTHVTAQPVPLTRDTLLTSALSVKVTALPNHLNTGHLYHLLQVPYRPSTLWTNYEPLDTVK